MGTYDRLNVLLQVFWHLTGQVLGVVVRLWNPVEDLQVSILLVSNETPMNLYVVSLSHQS